MQYKIMVATDVRDLERQATYALVEGWKMQGGVCVDTTNGNTTSFYQAAIREGNNS